MNHAGSPKIFHRIAARVIDYVVISAVGAGIGVAIGFGFVWLLLTALLVFGYFVVGDVAAGTTLGKAALGLRVEGPSGSQPALGAALAREAFVLLGAVPFAGPLLALVAWVSLFVTIRGNPLGQGWHDRWAGGTRVVRKIA